MKTGRDAGTLLLRADASVAMGNGHVMRCLALAEAWQDTGGDVAAVVAQCTPALSQRLEAEKIALVCTSTTPGSVEDAAVTVDIARRRNARCVVIDGYHFDSSYQRRIKEAGLTTLIVDDMGAAAPYTADLVLNQNLNARAEMYPQKASSTRLMLGLRYALLRREFRAWRGKKRQIASVARKVLVTMGGSDPDNVTGRVLEALHLLRFDDLEAVVVVGGGNPHYESLLNSSKRPDPSIRLLRDVRNMPELLAWADIAVSAAGTTSWEISLLGLPAILVNLAENQKPIAQALQAHGSAVHLGSAANVTPEMIAASIEALLLDFEARTRMSQRTQTLLDGWGAERVVAATRGAGLRIRRVEEKDSRLLWEWANDAAVRSASFHSEPIAWNRHVEWLHSKLSDARAFLYLVSDSRDVPVGAVRYQTEGSRAVVSICIDPQFRSQGYGRAILDMGMDELMRFAGVASIEAYVKPGNEPSSRMFRNAGYKLGGPAEIAEQPALHFVLAALGPS